MKKKHTKEEWEIQKEHQFTDREFIESVLKILAMEVCERWSSHDSEEEESLMLYATNKQWSKHPLLYELIMGDGLDDDEFELALEQKLYADGEEFKCKKYKEVAKIKK